MTRKDYELIAKAIKRQRDGWISVQAYNDAEALTLLAEDLAGELKATNPAFDIARFLKACGVDA